MRDWQLRDQLVLWGTDREIPGQRAVIKQYGRDYHVEHFVGQTHYRKESRPTLVGAIRLAEKWLT